MRRLRIEEALAVEIADFRATPDGRVILRVQQHASCDGRKSMPLKNRKEGDFRDVPALMRLWEMVKDLPDEPLMPGNGRRYQCYGTVLERFTAAARVVPVIRPM